MLVFRRSDHSPHPKADRHSPQHGAEGQDGPQAAHPGDGFIHVRRPVGPARYTYSYLNGCCGQITGSSCGGARGADCGLETFSVYRPPLDWKV